MTPLLVVPHSDGTIQYDDFIELVYGSTTAAEEEASVWRVAQVWTQITAAVALRIHHDLRGD